MFSWCIKLNTPFLKERIQNEMGTDVKIFAPYPQTKPPNEKKGYKNAVNQSSELTFVVC